MSAKARQPAPRDALITRVCSRNMPIELAVPGREWAAPLKSRFLEMPAHSGGPILIEMPTLGGRPVALQQWETIDVTVTVEGQRYGFRALVGKRARVSLGGGGEVAALAITCPSAIAQLQRRRYYRVRVPALEPIMVECVGKAPAGADVEKDGKGLVHLDTRAMDISVGGMCVKIARKHSCLATAGTRLALIFKVDGSRRFKFIGEVRHLRALPRGDWAAGVQFVNPDSTAGGRRAIDTIARYVARRQREALRKKSGLE